MGEVISLSSLLKRRRTWVKRRVVFTNGVFDLIHYGHVKLLEECRRLGDILVVGLNSDGSVSRLKGPSRPILPFRDRSRILAALGCVDFVVGFREPTPLSLITRLRPDILVKGSDYVHGEIVGAKEVKGWGGRVVRIRLLRGRSTSDIIRTIVDRFGRESFT